MELDWQKSSVTEREAYTEYLLDFLDQKDDQSRLSVAQQLIYIAQGKAADAVGQCDGSTKPTKHGKHI
jgi:hypothetical protein